MIYPWLSVFEDITSFEGDAPIILLISITFPFGGLFNILIYCRPKINAWRRRERNQGMGWLRAWMRVIVAGDEVPSDSDSESRIELEGAIADVIHARRGGRNDNPARISSITYGVEFVRSIGNVSNQAIRHQSEEEDECNFFGGDGAPESNISGQRKSHLSNINANESMDFGGFSYVNAIYFEVKYDSSVRNEFLYTFPRSIK